MKYCFLLLVTCIPYRSVQHFVWPLHWCLLADICNHTWIPECGTDSPDNIHRRRLFVDECDMYEYNCDNVRDYVLINYSDCFNIPPASTHCPPVDCPKCPSLKAHRRHGSSTVRTTRRTPGVNLPKHMLQGIRRYTPRPRNKRNTESAATGTVILKREEVVVNGRKVLRIVKGFIERRKAKGGKASKESDYMQN